MAGDLFAVAVDSDLVAAPAEQAGVVVAGFAFVAPVVDVVDLADFLGGAAADAAAVPCDEAFAEAAAGFALGASQHDVAGVFVEDARKDVRVAGHCQGFLFGEAGAVCEAGVTDPLVDDVVVGEHDQLCARRSTAGVAVAGELFERVGEPLRWGGALVGVFLAE